MASIHSVDKGKITEAFASDGYVILKDFFSQSVLEGVQKELERLRKEIARLKKEKKILRNLNLY